MLTLHSRSNLAEYIPPLPMQIQISYGSLSYTRTNAQTELSNRPRQFPPELFIHHSRPNVSSRYVYYWFFSDTT
jgi:hypothetical protein